MKKIYIEKKVWSFRQFEIDDKKIYIKNKTIFDPEIDVNINLSVLKPEPDTITYKKFRSWLAISLFFISIFFSIICNDMRLLRYKAQFYPDFVIYSLVGIGILFKTRKKIEYKVFANKDEVYILDVGKFGKYKDEFNEFVELIIKKIKENAA